VQCCRNESHKLVTHYSIIYRENDIRKITVLLAVRKIGRKDKVYSYTSRENIFLKVYDRDIAFFNN